MKITSIYRAKKKNTLVSENATDEKKFYPGVHKFIFFNQFT